MEYIHSDVLTVALMKCCTVKNIVQHKCYPVSKYTVLSSKMLVVHQCLKYPKNHLKSIH